MGAPERGSDRRLGLNPDSLEGELRAAVVSVRDALRHLHTLRAADKITGADERGRFPDAALEQVPTVVVDANVLRNDIAYSCKHEGARTVLVNAANAGFIRLLCASHVIGDVDDHFQEWSKQAGVESLQFEAIWVAQYVPLLRMVAAVPGGLLSSGENERLDKFAEIDRDDIPSVTLSVLIEGFYLSQDGPATTAVYGEPRDQDELKRWRSALAAGGDAGVLQLMLDASVMAARLAQLGVGGMVSIVRGLPVWLQVAITGAATMGGVYAATRIDVDRSQGLREAAARLLRLLAAVSEVRQDAMVRFAHVRAPAPTMGALAEQLDASEILTRAVLRHLSRSRRSNLSAAEIARALPSLPVAQSERRVREALRSQEAAKQVTPGRWQLGEPVIWSQRASTTG